MGCDIHTYVEFSESRDDASVYWNNFTRNGGSRNYIMFGVLAGVRVPDVQLFEPKGMPEGSLGYRTSEDYWLNVAPEAHPEWDDDESWVSLDRATAWIESGTSVGDLDDAGRLRRVSGPDWHSHSWLTADELEQALNHYRVVVPKYWPQDDGVPPEWAAMLASMRSFEASGQQSRLVFWFDN